MKLSVVKCEEDEGNRGANSQFITGRIDSFANYIDLHIRYYRLIPYVAGGVAVFFLLRNSSVPLRRLRQVSDIPSELIKGNHTLSGVVKVTGHDSLGVWHIPLWKWMLKLGAHPPKECLSQDLLTVQFSGVSIDDCSAAATWLKDTVLEKRVRLRLLDYTSKDSVHCMVYRKKPGMFRLWKKICVNNELLKLGMGSVEEIHGVSSNEEYVRLTCMLLQSEQTAKEKGVGVWRGTEYVSTWNRFKNYVKK